MYIPVVWCGFIGGVLATLGVELLYGAWCIHKKNKKK